MNHVVAGSCLLLCCLSSCFLGRETTNSPLDPVVVRGIKIGTTAQEVVTKMGAPDEVVQLGRRSAYRYSHVVEKGTGSYWILVGFFNSDNRKDTAWFFFDEDQKLTHVGATFQSHRAGFHPFPWVDIYDPADFVEADKERGLTK